MLFREWYLQQIFTNDFFSHRLIIWSDKKYNLQQNDTFSLKSRIHSLSKICRRELGLDRELLEEVIPYLLSHWSPAMPQQDGTLSYNSLFFKGIFRG